MCYSSPWYSLLTRLRKSVLPIRVTLDKKVWYLVVGTNNVSKIESIEMEKVPFL